MNIMIEYLDLHRATINALRDYNIKKKTASMAKQRIDRRKSDLTSVKAPKIDGMPTTHNPHAMEEKITATLDDITLLEHSYERAKMFLDWFEPAWNNLSGDEQFILEKFYCVNDRSGENAVVEIASKLHISESYVYKIAKRTAEKLQELLFGAK